MPAAPTTELLAQIGRLATTHDRADAARQIARFFGGSDFLILLRDSEIGALLPAPGFRQTFPNGKAWRSFLRETIEHGEHLGTLQVGPAETVPAGGYAFGDDAAVLILGAAPPATEMQWIREIMPLIVATLRAEQLSEQAAVEARMARDMATRAAMLTQTVDRTRRQLEATIADLKVARTAAEHANKAKSEFLATMSHELRTPLNAIGGHVALLAMGLHGVVTEEQKISLARIDRNQRHLLGVINDILNLSRIEAGKVDYRMTSVSLRDVVEGLAPMIMPQLAEKSLAYRVALDESLPLVRADREKLEQVVLNLLSNSVKFTPRGGSIVVDALVSDSEDDTVYLRVSDTGVGIPTEKLEAVFDPFTQVDASHSRAGQGTGLGLSISRDLARGMGGDLHVRSTVGTGSTFTVSLPVAVGLTPEAPEAPLPTARAHRSAPETATTEPAQSLHQ